METKLPSYWGTPFTKICLGMTIGVETRFYLLDQEASSLYSLIQDDKYRPTTLGRDEWKKVLYSPIQDDKYRPTTLGRDEWKKLIGSQASLQQNCQKEGFNVLSDNTGSSKARIGIVGNNENDCITSDSRIGFGTGGYPEDSNTCGNVAKHGGDGGDENVTAMGYIFVQWKNFSC